MRTGTGAGAADIRLSLDTRLTLPASLRPDQRVEAYRLRIGPGGIALSSLTPEGLLRGAATLFQLARRERGRWVLPSAAITDWPNFRFRCASDWLINVECNRWAYDWGDGRAAFWKRIQRKLDFCFEHKINLVWFDGFGWDTERFPGYAALMRRCTAYARRRGIRLLFAGYGGGYGLAYQKTENTRNSGYFGQPFLNRRPWPDGPVYDCCGFPGDISREHGSCLSNAGLKAAKLAEMRRFVAEVNPGFMYIHDVDAANWVTTQKVWRQRCAACRRRWPSDGLASADGHAGAYAAWIRQVRRTLSALPPQGDYVPARDLTLIFVSPLYTLYYEPGAPWVWDREMRYFQQVSRLAGPEPGIEFGLREQFYDAGGRLKIGELRRRLDRVGHGHGLHVIAFGGGDNCKSDDLANISGTMAHFYDGAESVCLSNGGAHEEPVQLLNADCLWSGSAGGYRETPPGEAFAETVFKAIAAGTRRPAAIFGPGRAFDRLCERLWGPRAGRWMSRALTARRNGRLPVSHVWWSITQTLGKLEHEAACARIDWDEEGRRWADRVRATEWALRSARRAAGLRPADEDIRWLAICLEVGRQFADALRWLIRAKSGRGKAAAARLDRALRGLRAQLRARGPIRRTDILGGDPGCWRDSLARIERLAKAAAQMPWSAGGAQRGLRRRGREGGRGVGPGRKRSAGALAGGGDRATDRPCADGFFAGEVKRRRSGEAAPRAAPQPIQRRNKRWPTGPVIA